MEGLPESRSIFTTGEIADILGVNINTVVNWFEAGYLNGFKLPCSNARRVPRSELLEFITRHKLSAKPKPRNSVDVLLVSSHQDLAEQFHGTVESAFGYSLHIAANAFEAGMICATSMPDVVFVHLEHTDFDPVRFWLFLKGEILFSRPRLIVAAHSEPDSATMQEMELDGWLRLPTRADAILDWIDAAAAENISDYAHSKPRQEVRPRDLAVRKKYKVRLTEEQRCRLKEIASGGKASMQEIKRAKILLKTDAVGKSWPNKKIAKALGAGLITVLNVQRQFVQEGLEAAVSRKKHKKKQPYRKILDDEKEDLLIALSRSSPPTGHSRWTLHLLADKLVELKIVKSISYETVRQILKRTNQGFI